MTTTTGTDAVRDWQYIVIWPGLVPMVPGLNVELFDFCERWGLHLTVVRRPPQAADYATLPYMVDFDHSAVREEGVNQAAYLAAGWGYTVDATLHDYVRQLRGRVLVFTESYDLEGRPQKREIYVPAGLYYGGQPR